MPRTRKRPSSRTASSPEEEAPETADVELEDDEDAPETSVSGGNYFTRRPTEIDFIPSGCTLLDCVLGGGWPLGRVSNIVGDRSTGKTLLAIEAAANFTRKFPTGNIWYAEAEEAFDPGYAEALGMPIDRVEFVEDVFTVEDVFEHIAGEEAESGGILDSKEKDAPGLYVIDSLDALSDRAEQERSLDEGTYGGDKAKKLSQIFRRVNKRLGRSNIHLMVLSQIRDKIGVSFGRKYSRSGGRALDFYASQILYLAHIGEISMTRKGIKQATGVSIRVKNTKNKVGLPFRSCDFNIRFGYGVDDLAACVSWLAETKNKDLLDLSSTMWSRLAKDSTKLSDAEFKKLSKEASAAAEKLWYEVQAQFVSPRRKY